MFKPFCHIWCIHENSSRFAVTDYILANINCQRFTCEQKQSDYHYGSKYYNAIPSTKLVERETNNSMTH
jgi:hypothetical protein